MVYKQKVTNWNNWNKGSGNNWLWGANRFHRTWTKPTLKSWLRVKNNAFTSNNSLQRRFTKGKQTSNPSKGSSTTTASHLQGCLIKLKLQFMLRSQLLTVGSRIQRNTTFTSAKYQCLHKRAHSWPGTHTENMRWARKLRCSTKTSFWLPSSRINISSRSTEITARAELTRSAQMTDPQSMLWLKEALNVHWLTQPWAALKRSQQTTIWVAWAPTTMEA